MKTANRNSAYVLAVVLTAGVGYVIPIEAQTNLVELVPSGSMMPPVTPGKSPWGGGVKLAAAFLGWLSDQGLKKGIDVKLNDLQTQIEASMPRTGGVLIVI